MAQSRYAWLLLILAPSSGRSPLSDLPVLSLAVLLPSDFNTAAHRHGAVVLVELCDLPEKLQSSIKCSAWALLFPSHIHWHFPRETHIVILLPDTFMLVIYFFPCLYGCLQHFLIQAPHQMVPLQFDNLS